MAEFKLGEKVQYQKGDKWLKGVVHGVRKIDGKRGPQITGYLIDTGKTHLEGEVETPKGEDNIPYSQPVQVDVTIDQIKPE